MGRPDKSLPHAGTQGLTETIRQPDLTIRKEARELEELTTFFVRVPGAVLTLSVVCYYTRSYHSQGKI